MLKRIAKWILTMVDINVKLDEDVLNIEILMAGITLASWTIDLIKDDGGVKHGTKTKT